MRKEYLLAPGPTPVPPEVLLEMAKPVFHHRTAAYRKMHQEVLEDLKTVFRTKDDVYTMTSSGTGAMESAVVNVVSPGDKTLVVQGGKFGERWVNLCNAFGAKPIVINVEWGKPVDPEEIRKQLKANPDIVAVYTTLVETSTGVVTDMTAIGSIVKETNALLVCDGISSVGAIPMETDAWGIDMLVVGSQKALMLPPGLAFITVSPKAWKAIDARRPAAFYFDLKKARKNIATFDNPWTPAVTLMVGLKKSLELMKQRGIEQLWKDHARLAQATRAAVKAMGLKLFADPPADCVTAVRVPEGVDGEAVVKKLRSDYGITIAGGQDQAKGKVIRISNMGYVDDSDVVIIISALERVLVEMGHKFEIGSGLRAAQEALLRKA
ncbi:MAG TPA: alanine--glyoxylate aminotransferase family protein [Planctomycetota bacterium]|nr:alanine--glyoxylate aminotransferase family protein [Planctomycetota bacterium]